MSESRDPSPKAIEIELPPLMAADLSDTPVAKYRWYWTIAPAFAGVFVWVPYFDQLGLDTLPHASLPILIVAGLVAAILCDLLLFRAPALWGFRSEGRLSVVAASTFGTHGSQWITGPLLGIAAVVWHALSLTYALDLIFRGLLDARLLEPDVLQPWRVGSLTLKAPIVLLTAFWWVFITRLAGKSFGHVIATLMKVYTPTALGLIALTTAASIAGISPYRTGGAGDLLTSLEGTAADSVFPALWLIHLTFGFFAMAGLMAAEWGRTVPHERDVRIGGMVGVGAGCFLTTALALMTVAGSIGGPGRDIAKIPAEWRALEPPPFTYVRAVERTIGGPAAGLILGLLGIATLAPACYSAWVYTHRFYRQWPAISRKHWAWIGGIAAFLLVATSSIERTDVIFTIMGAVFAPAVGCIAADFRRQAGQWTGIRAGYNIAGIGAWMLGMAVGLLPEVGRLSALSMASRAQPASLLAFATAYLAYRLLSKLGLESKTMPTKSGTEA